MMRAAAMAMALAGVATAAKFDSYGNELKTCVPNLDGVVLKSENIESSLTTAGVNVMATSVKAQNEEKWTFNNQNGLVFGFDRDYQQLVAKMMDDPPLFCEASYQCALDGTTLREASCSLVSDTCLDEALFANATFGTSVKVKVAVDKETDYFYRCTVKKASLVQTDVVDNAGSPSVGGASISAATSVLATNPLVKHYTKSYTYTYEKKRGYGKGRYGTGGYSNNYGGRPGGYRG